jgi:hypothetical protein
MAVILATPVRHRSADVLVVADDASRIELTASTDGADPR